jgi:BASS family bile acid:Na+ symporter
MSNLTRTHGIITLLLLAIAIATALLKLVAFSGPASILFFLSLSAFMRHFKQFSGLSFTVLIFAAVTASMFYPTPFVELAGFRMQRLIVPLLMIIMFGMGTAMSIHDFIGVIKMPKGVLVGITCQFTMMPMVGYGLAYLTDLPPEIAAGIILVGCSPSGLASNVMAYISNANLALSLTLTAVATLLSPIFTPFLMKMLADQLVPIDFLSMLMSIVRIVIIPVIAGLVFHHFAHGRFKWLDEAMPKVSMAGITIIIAIITAAGRDSLLEIGLILIVAVIAHNVVGYFLGYWAGRMTGLDEQSARTVAFEVGMQNAGLASGIALEMGRVATMGLAPAVFGPFMNISGSSLATWWRGAYKSDENNDEVSS